MVLSSAATTADAAPAKLVAGKELQAAFAHTWSAMHDATFRGQTYNSDACAGPLAGMFFARQGHLCAAIHKHIYTYFPHHVVSAESNMHRPSWDILVLPFTNTLSTSCMWSRAVFLSSKLTMHKPRDIFALPFAHVGPSHVHSC